ncbi:MAG: hypothetical protein HYW90_02690 [Candidatus Sungbacteria bacterium]|nr:hypothetical protein [Candidatus Sungbacteria bacterium]
MPTITIPKTLPEKEKLIAVPQKIYEEFLEWQRRTKAARTFKQTKKELRSLELARKDFKKGKYVEWGELKHELAHLRKK